MNKFVCLLLFFLSDSVLANVKHEFWDTYEKNPAQAMQQLPRKFSADGKVIDTETLFTQNQIQNKTFIEIKDTYRKKICKYSKAGEACKADQVSSLEGITSGEVEYFLSNQNDIINSITEMENKSLLSGESEISPWSGDYWATYKGGLGHRYADPQTPRGKDWKSFYDYHKKSVDLKDENVVDFLSPSEKYDLLLNDKNNTLTRWSWNEGAKYYYSENKVETWFGLCHGWAPAAFRVDRPSKAIDIPAENLGMNIRFYPDDIKAIATLLWSNANFENLFLGGRCNDKDPKTDEKGRVISKDCWDANPGSWHMAVVNKIGLQKKSFVIDATYDYEVWNQPVQSYSYTYFNPETKSMASFARDAMVPLSLFKNDNYRVYRNPKTKYVVGIIMNLTYIVESSASHAENDGPEYDIPRTVEYIYDLELDGNGKIIGGEWYNNAHPDMLWTPTDNAVAVSYFDHLISGSWNGKANPPANWQRIAPSASQYGQPLSKVLEQMIKLSN